MHLPAIIRFSQLTNTNFHFHASRQKQKATFHTFRQSGPAAVRYLEALVRGAKT